MLVRDRGGDVIARRRQRARHHRTQGSRGAARDQRAPLQGHAARDHRHLLDSLREGRAVGEQTSWSAFTGQTSDELAGPGLARARCTPTTSPPRSTPGATRSPPARDRHGASCAAPRRRLPHLLRARGAGDGRTRRDHRVGGFAHRHHRAARSRSSACATACSGSSWRSTPPASACGTGTLDSGRMTWTRQTHLITGIARGTSRPRRAVLRTAGARRTSIMPTPSGATSRSPAWCEQSELQIRRPDGAQRWMQNRATAIFDAAGRMRRIVGTLRDITRRKELEAEREALLTAERAARSELGTAVAGQGRIPRDHLARAAHAAQRHPRLDHAAAATERRRRHDRRRTEGHRTQCASADPVARRPARCEPDHVGQAVADFRAHGSQRSGARHARLACASRIAARKIRIEAQLRRGPLPVMGDSVACSRS